MGTSGLRVLVADDDPDVLHDVSCAFESMGHHVCGATSGDELITRLGDEEPFDLIVTDISMPWMSGLQAMHSSRYAGLQTPVIVMTALRDAEIPDQVEALGRNALLLRKPFGMIELENAVDVLMLADQERRLAR
ncbi:MAG TPA: response regulator [Kofleriaceae bacterium]|nr:response regulator [Kofleriaceae bacterium]